MTILASATAIQDAIAALRMLAASGRQAGATTPEQDKGKATTPVTTTVPEPGSGEHRAEIIQDLIDLTTFLATHPDLPLPAGASIGVHCSIRRDGDDDAVALAGLAQLSRALGVQVTANRDGTHFTAARSFGRARYEACVVTDEGRARYQARMAAASAAEVPAQSPERAA